MASKALVLDANILIRAVLGRRVRDRIEQYTELVRFFVPREALVNAEEHLATLARKRGGDPEKALALLRSLVSLVEVIDEEFYVAFEAEARMRLEIRDQEDWPILALALSLDCPIWTEDSDFFGCGVATWTSNRVQIFSKVGGNFSTTAGITVMSNDERRTPDAAGFGLGRAMRLKKSLTATAIRCMGSFAAASATPDSVPRI